MPVRGVRGPTQIRIIFRVVGLLTGLLTSACDMDCGSDLTVSVSDEAGVPVAGAQVELLGYCCENLMPPHCVGTTNEQERATVRAYGGRVCTVLVSSPDHESLNVDTPTECFDATTTEVVLVRK